MSNPYSGRREKVIVFGANGFLGSVVTKKLHKSGFDVISIIRPRADKSRLSDMEKRDIREIDVEKWPEVIGQIVPNTVICAQWNGVSKQDRYNFELQSSNIESIVTLADSAKESKVQNFLCFGSQAEARESTQQIKEEFYSSGESAYGVAKSTLHYKLATNFANSECRFIWARVFSVYGPSDFSDSLLTQIFESQGEKNDLLITNPTKLWSFLYQDDFASAIEAILENLNIAGTVNIGNPVLNEIREVVAIWNGISLRDCISYQSNQGHSGYFPQLRKLQSVGWSPSISLNEGIGRTRRALIERADTK